MNQNKLVSNFVIGTFVTLYLLVSIISTIHVIDFFKLSNPYWLAVTLAIGFEIGAAASLASLVILKKMNKTLVWALFITITLMQMQGNMYYAFINLTDFTSWSELFNLIEEEPLYQKRILAFVSGAILPLIALGFIKSLVDYIKPDEEVEELTSGSMDDNMLMSNDFETKPSDEYFEDLVDLVERNPKETAVKTEDPIVETHITTDHNEILDEYDSILSDDLELWDNTLMDGLENEVPDNIVWDEDHALDQTLNVMVEDMPIEEIEEPVVNTAENILGLTVEFEPEIREVNPTSVGAVVEAAMSKEDISPIKSEEEMWNEAMEKKAKQDMQEFLKNKNGDKKA